MDTIIDYLFNNHDKLLYLLAAVSLIVELTLIGLSGPLLFFAIGCALTGVLVSLNVITSWEMELLFVGIFTLLSSIVMWKPLKQFQGNGKVKDNSSDMIGQSVAVSEILTKHGGSIRFSGINWTARLAEDSQHESIAIGQHVNIHAVDGNVMIIK
ncbi:acriflavin resistance protein [Psychromonas sp. psych-6C06]|uniref:NfeD family protein n=1 Tax=Psychromonas sp. psych-6C06 TaxID=2058089 RepID=UPI000C34DB67|nr:NfeD family protein [Psychromonas sp. psych-6C06]PKF63704.1 acriflavin resistance protein [Psychromonas sp. psych-6C06]